jgi:hypothetical protein
MRRDDRPVWIQESGEIGLFRDLELRRLCQRIIDVKFHSIIAGRPAAFGF